MLFQLGDYVFEGLKLPQTWGLSFATNYAQVPIINGKAVVQKTGEKLVEQEFSVLFSDEFCNPTDEINALQAYRRNGNVLPFSGGDGTNYGNYVITEITQTNERANDSTGYISAISATIKLLEYNSTSTTTVNNGAALRSRNLKPVTPKPPTVFQAASLQKDITAGVQMGAVISSDAKQPVINFAKIVKTCSDAKAAFQSADAKVNSSKKILTRAIDLKSSLQTAGNALNDVQAAAYMSNAAQLIETNVVLERAMYDLTSASAPVAAFVGSREAGI